MNKSHGIMAVSAAVALFMIGKAFILNEDIKLFLLVFFAVGCGLALLRLFVNSSIKKMKGKSLMVKILFFAVLLGLGLPFQAWFREEVLFSMNSDYLMNSIIILVVGVFFMTTFFGFIMKNTFAKQASKQ